jgi:hypothetical protein
MVIAEFLLEPFQDEPRGFTAPRPVEIPEHFRKKLLPI